MRPIFRILENVIPTRNYFDRKYRELYERIEHLERLVEYTGSKLGEEVTNEEMRQYKRIPRPSMEYLIVNVVDHCNLRCKGCDHFSNIAEEYIVPYETISADVQQMARLFGHDNIAQIAVMGGEPLLHPELIGILMCVRENFPDTVIRLSTNGILLMNMGAKFWEICRENRIRIVVTRYPIELDYSAIEEKAASEHVSFIYYEDTNRNTSKKMSLKRIDLEGSGDPVINFYRCPVSAHCNFLMEGKLYPCPFMCQSYRIFNKRFKTSLQLKNGDYIDIYQSNIQEVLEFQSIPKRYCRYCPGTVPDQEWQISNGSIDEYVISEKN